MDLYRHAASALVLRGWSSGQVLEILLVHKPRKFDSWQLPQGGIEEGETLEGAALRELHEEAGIVLSAVHHVSQQTYSYDFPPGFIAKYHPTNRGQQLHFVSVLAPGDLVITVDNHEIDNYRWVKREELPRYLKRKAYLDTVHLVLDEALKRL